MFRNVIGVVTNVLIVVAALTFILNVLALVLPVYMLQVYDRVLPSSSLATLLYLTLIAVAALAILGVVEGVRQIDRKSTRLNSSHLGISYAVFCLKKKNTTTLVATVARRMTMGYVAFSGSQ